MKSIALGTQGLHVPAVGLGCMGLTSFYGTKLPDDQVISFLSKAAEKGAIFWDTANSYVYTDWWRLLRLQSPLVCQEELLGLALKQIGRHNIVIATKTGIEIQYTPIPRGVSNGAPSFVRGQCNDSLRRLGVDYIDLFYLHRIDPNIPIERTMCEMKKLVEEGKVKYLGLSECSAATLRRAHAVHPISAVQVEYSLWCRGAEGSLMEACAQLGVGIVAYSPLGRGFLTESPVAQYGSGDFRATQPRMTGEQGERNRKLVDKLTDKARDMGVSVAQLCIAWVRAQQFRLSGAGVVPIPGSTKMHHLESNIASAEIELDDDTIATLEEAVPADQVEGQRYGDDGFHRWETEENVELTEEEARTLGLCPSN